MSDAWWAALAHPKCTVAAALTAARADGSLVDATGKEFSNIDMYAAESERTTESKRERWAMTLCRLGDPVLVGVCLPVSLGLFAVVCSCSRVVSPSFFPSLPARPPASVICATGFQPGDVLGTLPLRVDDQPPIQHKWRKDGASAYLTTAPPGCPNFFAIAGPNSTIGHTSAIFVTECISEYIVQVCWWWWWWWW